MYMYMYVEGYKDENMQAKQVMQRIQKQPLSCIFF